MDLFCLSLCPITQIQIRYTLVFKGISKDSLDLNEDEVGDNSFYWIRCFPLVL